MLVKFFANKQGGNISGINYLLNHRVKDQTVYVIKGSESITRNIVLSITKKQKLCMGCLSLEEKDIDLKTKQAIIDEFNTLMFADDKNRYNILWVEHTDKQILELNFAIPKIDLITGLAFNPYYDKADRKLVNFWQNHINFKFGFTDPKDPSKAHILQGSRKELNTAKDYIELEKILTDKFIDNEFGCRDDILRTLKDSNIEVTRIGKEYISIKLPNSKKAKRFKRAMFHESFADTASLEQFREKTQRRAKEFKDRADESNIKHQRESNQSIARRSYLFTDEFRSNNQREFRIIKFKQQLSKRDRELNRLKTNFDRQTQKRNNWLKEQSSRESRGKFYIKDSSNSVADIFNNVRSFNLEDQTEQFNTNISKQTDESIYTTKYEWQPAIDNKNRIFTTRMYHDTIRARVIKRIRDKREAREGENRIIQTSITRIKKFGQETNRLKGSIQRTKYNTTRISKFIDGFRRKMISLESCHLTLSQELVGLKGKLEIYSS